MTRWAKIMPRGACRGQGFHRGTQGSECTSTSRWHKIRGCLSIHRWSGGTKRPRARKLRCSVGHSWLCWGSWWSQPCHSVCNKDDDENERDKVKFFKNWKPSSAKPKIGYNVERCFKYGKYGKLETSMDQSLQKFDLFRPKSVLKA